MPSTKEKTRAATRGPIPGGSPTPPEIIQPAALPPERLGRPTYAEKKARRRYKEQHDFLVGCTADERAHAVQLVRLLRTSYWLSDFARHLLRMDGSSPCQVTINAVETQLENVRIIECAIGKAQYVARRPDSYYWDHPALKAIREDWGELDRYKGDQIIQELIDSAKAKVEGKK